MVLEKAKSIAVAVDGSAPGWEAMRRAVNMAHLLELPLDVLHVIQVVKAGYFAFIDRHLQEEHESYARQVLEEAAQRGQKAGVEVRTHLLQGEKDPSEAIVAFLEQSRGIKFLVLGSHGHSFVRRHLIGSVAERVIREVTYRGLPVPILIVPASAAAEAETKA